MGISPEGDTVARVPNGYDAATAPPAVGGGAAPGQEVMSPNCDNNNSTVATGNGPPDVYNISDGDGDVPMWEPTEWMVMREQRVQREVCISTNMMEHLSGMVAKQSDEHMGNLRNNMRELADACIMRTQVLAESVFELSAANKTLMES